jgi:putative hydrolase of the HAD superfamily
MIAQPGVYLFDLDDTIVNYDGVSDACWRQLCQEYAPRLDGMSAQALYDAIAAVRAWYWADMQRARRARLDLTGARREVVALALAELGAENPGLSRLMADAYTERREEHVHLYPGAIDCLRRLKARGIPLGLVTNSTADFQRRKIERFALAQYFDVVRIEGEFGVGKPDPRIFLSALEALGVDPSQAGMVGNDLEYDIRPALALGMQAVWVDNTGAGLPEGCGLRPTRILAAIAELDCV